MENIATLALIAMILAAMWGPALANEALLRYRYHRKMYRA